MMTIDVLAGGAGTSVRDGPQFTVARGGVLPVRDAASYPASGGRYKGMALWDIANEVLVVKRATGDTWVPVAQVGGWETIVSTTISGNTDIDITLGGRYPAGTFDTIWIKLVGGLTESAEQIAVRVNGDSTAGLHEWAYTATELLTGGVDSAEADESGIWEVARWGGNDNCTAECTIYGTDADALLSFQGEGYRSASTQSLRQRTLSGGQLASSRLLSSVEIRASGLATPKNTPGVHVTIAGHRPLP